MLKIKKIASCDFWFKFSLGKRATSSTINCKSNRVELAYRDELECFPNSVQVSTRAYSTPNSKFCMVYLDTDIVVSGVSVCRNLSSTSLVSIISGVHSEKKYFKTPGQLAMSVRTSSCSHMVHHVTKSATSADSESALELCYYLLHLSRWPDRSVAFFNQSTRL
jgi:hypothetical protein